VLLGPAYRAPPECIPDAATIPPISTPSSDFRHVISGSLAHVSPDLTWRSQVAAFSATLTTNALDTNLSQRFGANSWSPAPRALPSSPLRLHSSLPVGVFAAHVESEFESLPTWRPLRQTAVTRMLPSRRSAASGRARRLDASGCPASAPTRHSQMPAPACVPRNRPGRLAVREIRHALLRKVQEIHLRHFRICLRRQIG
jgi:hypothetical protein